MNSLSGRLGGTHRSSDESATSVCCFGVCDDQDIDWAIGYDSEHDMHVSYSPPCVLPLQGRGGGSRVSGGAAMAGGLGVWLQDIVPLAVREGSEGTHGCGLGTNRCSVVNSRVIARCCGCLLTRAIPSRVFVASSRR